MAWGRDCSGLRSLPGKQLREIAQAEAICPSTTPTNQTLFGRDVRGFTAGAKRPNSVCGAFAGGGVKKARFREKCVTGLGVKRQISQNGPIHSGNVVTLTDDYHGKVWATDGSFKTGEGVGYGMADSPQEGTTISARTDGPKTAGTGESMGIMHGVIASPDDEPFRILTDHKFSTDTIQSLLNPHEKLRGQTSNLCVYRTID